MYPRICSILLRDFIVKYYVYYYFKYTVTTFQVLDLTEDKSWRTLLKSHAMQQLTKLHTSENYIDLPFNLCDNLKQKY
jgi:hypothetical protein